MSRIHLLNFLINFFNLSGLYQLMFKLKKKKDEKYKQRDNKSLNYKK